MNSHRDRVLIVDDNIEMHTLLEACLHPVSDEVVSTDSGREALDLLQSGDFAIVVLDLMLPDLDGIQILKRIRENQPETKVIILTAHGSLETAIEALRLGAYDYVEKPFYVETVRAAVQRALDKRRIDSRLQAIQDLSREITLLPDVGQAANAVMDFVERLLAFQHCALMLLDEDGQQLSVLVARGKSQEIATRVPLDDVGISGTAVREARMVHVPQVNEDDRCESQGGEVRPAVAMPLIVKESILGVLRMEGSQEAPLGQDDLGLLSTLADQAAVAIKNAQLHEQAQREIAQRREVEAALREAKERAETANRAKSEFLARMSHEIRTPIHGIRGVTELMLDTDVSPEQQQYLDLIHGSALSLSSVVSDILDFSKIEAGKLELETAVFDLRAVAEGATALAAPQARAKGLELVCRVPPRVPTALVGDSEKLREVVANLVDNAVKFTHQGEVVISVEVQDETAQDAEIEITVQDTGVGIDEEKLSTIFRAFHQADTSTTREYGGTGLGLTIADRLVRAMGGRIWLESALGEGSTFHVGLRLDKQQVKPSLSPLRKLAVSQEGARILVVDDNAASRLMLREQLTHWGSTVTEAETYCAGLAALGTTPDSDGSQGFDLVLLDVGDVNGDGLAKVREIQARMRPGQVLVPLLSSSEIHKEIKTCRGLGIRRCLVKPIEQDALLTTVSGALAQEPPAEHVGSSEDRQSRYTLNVLLVEDNRAAQLVGKRTLERAGHSVRVVGDGKGALECVENNALDLVLMDIEMPQLDGLEVIRRIRRGESGEENRLPIVAISAYATETDRERSLAAGADAYLPKPVSPADLEAWIGEFFSSGQPRRRGDVVDLEAALEATAGDQSLLAEAVGVFVAEDYPRHLASLKDALERRDSDGIAEAAHGIAGPVESFGGRAVAEAASELKATACGGDFAGAHRVVERLEAEMERFGSFFLDL